MSSTPSEPVKTFQPLASVIRDSIRLASANRMAQTLIRSHIASYGGSRLLSQAIEELEAAEANR